MYLFRSHQVYPLIPQIHAFPCSSQFQALIEENTTNIITQTQLLNDVSSLTFFTMTTSKVELVNVNFIPRIAFILLMNDIRHVDLI